MYNSRYIGSENENIACDYLREKGYEILARNYRVRAGEIDIVARDDGYLVFVEVKFRSNSHMGPPAEAVNVKKTKQISKVALYFLNQYGFGTDTAVRFDVITVSRDGVEHIVNAFDYAGW